MYDKMPGSSPNYITDNAAERRFELVEEGHTAFADYIPRGDVLVIPYVESPVPLRGKGTAARLLEGVAEKARAEGFKLAPTCSYAVAWFRRHPQWNDVLA